MGIGHSSKEKVHGGSLIRRVLTDEYSKDEFEALVTKAQEYKAVYSDPATKATAPKPLAGEICSMIFQKRSTRTRSVELCCMEKTRVLELWS